MLQITVPENELWDPVKQEFIQIKEQTLRKLKYENMDILINPIHQEHISSPNNIYKNIDIHSSLKVFRNHKNLYIYYNGNAYHQGTACNHYNSYNT